MLCRFFDESAGHFWQPEEFENVANPYFKNLEHLQNPGHLLLTAPSFSRSTIARIKKLINNQRNYCNIYVASPYTFTLAAS